MMMKFRPEETVIDASDYAGEVNGDMLMDAVDVFQSGRAEIWLSLLRRHLEKTFPGRVQSVECIPAYGKLVAFRIRVLTGRREVCCFDLRLHRSWVADDWNCDQFVRDSSWAAPAASHRTRPKLL